MIYDALRDVVAWAFRVSPHPPHVPPGAHGVAHVFRASLAYWEYQLFFLAVRLFLLAPFAFGAAGAAVVFGIKWRLPRLGIAVGALVLVFYVAFALVSYVVARLDYEFRWYVLTDRSLRIRQGIGTFEETTLTFANVQNVEIQQGPVERWFGFKNVVVETAGGGGGATGQEGLSRAGRGHRGLVRGLDQAEHVRDAIRQAVIRQGGTGLGDRDERAAAASPAVGLALAVPHLRGVLDEVQLLRKSLEAPPPP